MLMPDRSSSPSLRQVVLSASGQDLRVCRNCLRCDIANLSGQEIPFSILVRMILLNHTDVLDSPTMWSDEVLAAARRACIKGLNLEAALLALRDEAEHRAHQKFIND